MGPAPLLHEPEKRRRGAPLHEPLPWEADSQRRRVSCTRPQRQPRTTRPKHNGHVSMHLRHAMRLRSGRVQRVPRANRAYLNQRRECDIPSLPQWRWRHPASAVKRTGAGRTISRNSRAHQVSTCRSRPVKSCAKLVGLGQVGWIRVSYCMRFVVASHIVSDLWSFTCPRCGCRKT